MIPVSYNLETLTRDQATYDLLNSWWAERGGCALAMDMWPSRGRMVTFNGEPAAAYFLLVDPPFAMMTFYVSNPFIPIKTRGTAIRVMVEFFLDEAKTNKCTVGFVSCQYSGMIKLLRSKGFKNGDMNVTHLLRAL